MFAFQLFSEITGAHGQTAYNIFSLIYGNNESVSMTKCRNTKEKLVYFEIKVLLKEKWVQ